MFVCNGDLHPHLTYLLYIQTTILQINFDRREVPSF